MLFAISSPWGPFFLAALTKQLKDELKEKHFTRQIFFGEGRGGQYDGKET